MRTVPCSEPLRRVSFSIFPKVRYTGHACLSPWKRVNLVLSEDKMTEAIVAPRGSFSCCESMSAISDRSRAFNCVQNRALTCVFHHQSPVHISS